MSNYNVTVDDDKDCVCICYCTESCHYLDSFLTIWTDNYGAGISSPFRNIEDVELFAEIIVKLLEVVTK